MKAFAAAAAVLSLAVLAPPGQAQPAPAERTVGMIGIKFASADFDKTITFYSHLGMKLGRKPNDIEWQLISVDPAQPMVIYMVRDRPGQSRLRRGGAFIMFSVDDVGATAARLRAAGFLAGEPRINPRYSMLMIEDPDGNQIELLGPGKPE